MRTISGDCFITNQTICTEPVGVFFFFPLLITKWCFFSLSLARSHMIDSPPTFNADYGYKSWEAYSNLSYYTRTLPPVPEDCPTPMGVEGEFAFTASGEPVFSDSCILSKSALAPLHHNELIPSARLRELICAEGTQHNMPQQAKTKEHETIFFFSSQNLP